MRPQTSAVTLWMEASAAVDGERERGRGGERERGGEVSGCACRESLREINTPPPRSINSCHAHNPVFLFFKGLIISRLQQRAHSSVWCGRRLHMSGWRKPTDRAAGVSVLGAAYSPCCTSTGFMNAPSCWVFRVWLCQRRWSALLCQTEFKCAVLSLSPSRQLWKSALLCRHLAAAGGCRTARGTAESRFTWSTTGGGLRGVRGGASIHDVYF